MVVVNRLRLVALGSQSLIVAGWLVAVAACNWQLIVVCLLAGITATA